MFTKLHDGTAIIAFRNRVIHRNDTVDSEIVWDGIESKVPRLREAADALLAALA
ncbi:MAG: HepT-like ribonuclease domain-containing protein [Gemmatimonadaceae bacterium]